MQRYIYDLDRARFYTGSAHTAVGEVDEEPFPWCWSIASKMNILTVKPLPSGDVALRIKWSHGKHLDLVVSQEVARSSMGIATALRDKGVWLPIWVRYVIDVPNRPVVVYCKAIR